MSRVMAEVDDDVRRRRASGELPSARERELDDLFVAHSPASGQGANLRQALERVDRAMYVDPVVPVDSNHRAGGAIKRGMRSASLWYVGWLTHQINQFASATSRSLHLIEQRLIELEGGDGVQRAPRAEVVEFPELHGGEAWWVAPAIDAVGPAPGRTLHAACGDGWLVRRLVAAGRDAYGVDPRPGRAAPERGRGLRPADRRGGGAPPRRGPRRPGRGHPQRRRRRDGRLASARNCSASPPPLWRRAGCWCSIR